MNEQQAHEMLMTVALAMGIGPLLVVLARRTVVPAIVWLMAVGIFLGPEFLHIINPDSLGGTLRVVVELAVAVILFEGGLTLDLQGRKSASGVIDRLLSIGVLTTWLLTALAVWVLFDFPVGYSLLTASLVIVTGPTVIGPLLKRLRLTERLHNILHWEGVLIDPIGVFVALLCFEWVSGYGASMALSNFALRFAVGLAIGVIGGFLIYYLIRMRSTPEDMVNEMTLALAILVFGASEALISKAGLLSVAVAGFVVGLKQPPELKRIREFKAELTDLLIGLLFILLSARLEPGQFQAFGWRGLALVGLVMVVVRPLNILISTVGQSLNWREKIFLGWMAPRGIVAASMASLFAITLETNGQVDNPRFIETFTYSVIMATVVLQGLTAQPLAQLLGLRRPRPVGWAIVGAHRFGRLLARFLTHQAEVQAILLDTNPKAVAEACLEGLQAIECDATDSSIPLRHDMLNIGNLLALTDNQELNIVLCSQWAPTLGRRHLFRWSPEKINQPDANAGPGQAVWPHLPKPSILSAELMRGEAWTEQVAAEESEPDPKKTALMAIAGKKALIDPVDISASNGKAKAILYLVREANYLLRCIDEKHAMRISATDTQDLFEQIFSRIAGDYPDLPVEEIVKELVERESNFPTVLGYGVAVPHLTHRQVPQRRCILAQIPAGLDFRAPDMQPVRLVFLLLSPPKDAEGHLATLGEISRLVSDPQWREQLLEAESPQELVRHIRTALEMR